jgi:hypothetical protein
MKTLQEAEGESSDDDQLFVETSRVLDSSKPPTVEVQLSEMKNQDSERKNLVSPTKDLGISRNVILPLVQT